MFENPVEKCSKNDQALFQIQSFQFHNIENLCPTGLIQYKKNSTNNLFHYQNRPSPILKPNKFTLQSTTCSKIPTTHISVSIMQPVMAINHTQKKLLVKFNLMTACGITSNESSEIIFIPSSYDVHISNMWMDMYKSYAHNTMFTFYTKDFILCTALCTTKHY